METQEVFEGLLKVTEEVRIEMEKQVERLRIAAHTANEHVPAAKFMPVVEVTQISPFDDIPQFKVEVDVTMKFGKGN